MTTKRIHLNTQEEAIELFGQNDEHLRELEKKYKVQFFVRPSTLPSGEGLTLAIRGRTPHIDKAITALEARRGNSDDPHLPQTNGHKAKGEVHKDMIIRTVTGHAIRPRNSSQEKYIEAMKKHDLVVGIGPAGTGKTFLAVTFAMAELESGRFNKIVLTRPVVEAGEKLGFLPGDFYEKVHPYLRPLYDAFYTIVGPERFRLMREDEVVEIVPLAYMRGRTLDNALIILDEAQNTTPEQMKMFLTRMGNHSKMIVNGDLTQIDLDDKKRSGLIVADKILTRVDGIEFVRFKNQDVVRHSLVQKILKAYDDHSDNKESK